MTNESPVAIEVIENLWIPLSDGTQVAARMWLPTDDDPTSACSEFWSTMRMSRVAWSTKTQTHTKLTCDDENFFVEAEVTALEGKDVVFSENGLKRRLALTFDDLICEQFSKLSKRG